MKISSKIMKAAHELTKEIKAKYPEADYRAQLGICIKFLLKKGEVKMIELKGTEKQIKYANDIKKELLNLTKQAFEIANQKRFESKGKYYDSEKKVYKQYNKFLIFIKNEENAKYIIENFKFVLDKDNIKYFIYDKLIKYCARVGDLVKMEIIFNKAKNNEWGK